MITFFSGPKGHNWQHGLQQAKDYGFKAVRCFSLPYEQKNHRFGIRIFNDDGSENAYMNIALDFTQHCKHMGLIVEWAHWQRFCPNMTSDGYAKGIALFARKLKERGLDNVWFDMQNELSDLVLVGMNGVKISLADMDKAVKAVRAVHPKLFLCFSNTYTATLPQTGEWAKLLKVDGGVAWHPHREEGCSPWYKMDQITRELYQHSGIPVIENETLCSDWDTYPSSHQPVDLNVLRTHRQGCINGGAKTWCLHHHAWAEGPYPGQIMGGLAAPERQMAEHIRAGG